MNTTNKIFNFEGLPTKISYDVSEKMFTFVTEDEFDGGVIISDVNFWRGLQSYKKAAKVYHFTKAVSDMEKGQRIVYFFDKPNWIAYHLDEDVSGYGDTPQEALTMINFTLEETN